MRFVEGEMPTWHMTWHILKWDIRLIFLSTVFERILSVYIISLWIFQLKKWEKKINVQERNTRDYHTKFVYEIIKTQIHDKNSYQIPKKW